MSIRRGHLARTTSVSRSSLTRLLRGGEHTRPAVRRYHSGVQRSEYISELETVLSRHTDVAAEKISAILDACPAEATALGFDVFPDQDGEGPSTSGRDSTARTTSR